MSAEVARGPLSLISGDQITSLQLAEEIKTLLQISKVKQIEIAFQENSSTQYLLRIDLAKRVIEASSHLPEKVITALSQTFGDSLTIHVRPEKVGDRTFVESNKNLLFNKHPAHANPQKDIDNKAGDQNNVKSPTMKKF